MNDEQSNQQQAQAPQQMRALRRKFVKQGFLAVMGGAVSAATRYGTEAVLRALFGNDS